MASFLDELTSTNPHLAFGERAVSVVLGLGLAAAAAKPRPNPLLNLAALLAGVALAYRGATGYCHAKAALDERGQGGRVAHRAGFGDRRLAAPAAPHGPSIPNTI